jgi:hypothetical protein
MQAVKKEVFCLSSDTIFDSLYEQSEAWSLILKLRTVINSPCITAETKNVLDNFPLFRESKSGMYV